MKECKLVSNIDTICVLVDIENYEISAKNVLNLLDIEKEKAKQMLTLDATHKHYIEIGEFKFELLTSGTKGYSCILQNSAYKIYIAKYKAKLKSFAPIQIRISSEHLWSYGIGNMWEIIYNWVVENFGNICKEKVCRLDLCTHVSSMDFTTNYEKCYKGDYRKSQVFKTNNTINAITFGSRQNKNIYCRIYNKTLEIKEKRHKIWFFDIWENNNLDITNVWNVEFEVKSKLLKRFNIETVQDVITHIKDLWEFCTKDWLVKVDNTNTRIERCKVNEQWKQIQNAFFYLSSVGLIERKKQINLDADILIPNIAGFITSYSARKNIVNINESFDKVKKDISRYFKNKNTTFELEVKIKNIRLNDCEVKKND